MEGVYSRMDNPLVPDFVDRNRFCRHFLVTLERLCEKYTESEKSDVVELDFSRQLYLVNGAVVNGKNSESDEEDGEAGDIVIDMVPKRPLPDKLEDLPTDILELPPSEDICISSTFDGIPKPFSRPAHCNNFKPTAKLDMLQCKQPVAIVSPLLPPLPSLDSPSPSRCSPSGRKSPTLSGRETVALLSPWSTGKLRRRSCSSQHRRGSSVRQSLFSEVLSIGQLPTRLFVHQRSQSHDSLLESALLLPMRSLASTDNPPSKSVATAMTSAATASSLHFETSLISTEHSLSRPVATEGMSPVFTERSSSKLSATTVKSPMSHHQAVKRSHCSNGSPSPMSHYQAVKRSRCSNGTPTNMKMVLSMSDILKDEPLLCLSPVDPTDSKCSKSS